MPPRSRDCEGELFASAEPPHLVGYLVIDGVHYEIAGVRRSAIRTEIKARRRGPPRTKNTQIDMFEGSDDEQGGTQQA